MMTVKNRASHGYGGCNHGRCYHYDRDMFIANRDSRPWGGLNNLCDDIKSVFCHLRSRNKRRENYEQRIRVDRCLKIRLARIISGDAIN